MIKIAIYCPALPFRNSKLGSETHDNNLMEWIDQYCGD